MSNNCRRGKRTPIDGTTYKNVKVEVGAEIGLMLNAKAKYINGKLDIDYIESQVKDKLLDILYDGTKDVTINNSIIYSLQ